MSVDNGKGRGWEGLGEGSGDGGWNRKWKSKNRKTPKPYSYIVGIGGMKGVDVESIDNICK